MREQILAANELIISFAEKRYYNAPSASVSHNNSHAASPEHSQAYADDFEQA